MNALTFLVFFGTIEEYLCTQYIYLFNARLEDSSTTSIKEELRLIDDGLEPGVVSFRVSTPADLFVG